MCSPQKPSETPHNQPPIRGHPLRIQLDLRSDGVCIATMKSGEVNLITGTLGRQKESNPKMDPKWYSIVMYYI